MPNRIIQLQITWPKRQEAADAARCLVNRGLAACAQIAGPIESIYRWKGETCSDKEWLLLLKTSLEKFPVIQEEISKIHPYECPQIVALPLECISEPYQKWLYEQLSGTGNESEQVKK